MMTAMLLRCEGCGRPVPTLHRMGLPAERPVCGACAEATGVGATWG